MATNAALDNGDFEVTKNSVKVKHSWSKVSALAGDRLYAKNTHRDLQTSGPWTTKASRGLQINDGSVVVKPGISDQKEKRNTWYLRPRLKKQIVLVALSFYTLVVSFGYVLSLAVLFVPIRDTFGTNTAETALVRSVCLGSLLCAGIVISPLFLKFGAGPVGFAGSIVATSGLVISFFAPSFPVLLLSGGFMTGVGLCCQHVITFTVVGTAIKSSKWRDFSLTLISSSAGIGFSFLPYVTVLLLEQFGWRGAMLLQAGVTLNCCPAFLLIASISRDLAEKDQKMDETSESKSHWNFSLFKEFGFIAVCASVFVAMAFIPTVNYFLVDMSISKGFTIKTGAFFLSVAGLSGLAGRFACVVLTAVTKGSKILVIAFLYLMAGAFITLLPFAKTYTAMVTAIPLYNIPYGAQAVLFPVALYEVVGIHRYASAMGYSSFIGGLGTWISGPVGGMIKDLTDSYDGVVYLGVFGGVSCALCFFLMHVYNRRSVKQNAHVHDEEVDTYL